MFFLWFTHKVWFVFFWQHITTEPFEPSPFIPPRDFDDDCDTLSGRQQGPVDGNFKVPISEKEINVKESSIAKIKVVVRCVLDSALISNDGIVTYAILTMQTCFCRFITKMFYSIN